MKIIGKIGEIGGGPIYNIPPLIIILLLESLSSL